MITLSVNKFNTQNTINSVNDIIKLYNNYRDCNDFSDLVCPLCGNKGCLHFHKVYERNLTYYENGELINTIVEIIVCKCEHCEKAHNKQKYHALLPEFVLPYHIYEASTIIKAINDYYNKNKLQKIMEKLHITHKLFYDWLRKLKKYTLSSSIILKTINDIKEVVLGIVRDNSKFLISFYDDYNHPFFLFKTTCVPLCIIL